MNALTGTGTLTRIAVRRDLPLTAGIGALFATLLAAVSLSFQDSYPDDVALAQYAAAMRNSPVQRFFNGPGDGLDSIGGMVVFEIGGYFLVAVAVFAILCVVRHSRAMEASGVAEMVRAGCTGSQALGASAAIVAIGSATAWGLACALTLGLLGLGWAGAAVYGASLAAVGALFATVAGITCQLAGQPRTATLLASAILAVSFVVRGVGDMRGNALTWASPFGWAQAGRPFGQERAWPFLIVLGVVALGQLSATALGQRRDLGSGRWPARPGTARASRWLQSIGGLVRSQILPLACSWWLVIAGFSLSFGLVSAEFAEANDQIDMSAFFGEGTDQVAGLIEFSSLLLALLSTAAGIAVIAVAGREESSGRLDAIVATRVSRERWALSFTAGAAATSGIGIAVAAGCMSLGVAWAGTEYATWDVIGPIIAYLPAVWLIVALALALFGLRARALPIAWVVFTYCVVAGVFGRILRLPAWAIDLSPFAHAPRPPSEALVDGPVAVLTALAIAAAAVGIALFNRRDVDS